MDETYDWVNNFYITELETGIFHEKPSGILHNNYKKRRVAMR